MTASAAPVLHDTFTIERTYRATAKQVYAAWSNIDAKAKWFAGPEGWTSTERTLDFRVGGQERVGGTFPDGVRTSLFVATYFDIVEDKRILYTYEMYVSGKKISVSLVSIELFPGEGGGTRMVVTEHGAYFGGKEEAVSRIAGSEWLMDKLDVSIGEPVGGVGVGGVGGVGVAGTVREFPGARSLH